MNDSIVAKVLVLDDEYDVCVLVKRVVEKLGHEVAIFTKGEEALNWAAHENPDFAILDMREGFSRAQVLEALKRLNNKTRVIITTTDPSSGTAKQAMALGSEAYLAKPIKVDDLEKMVIRLVRT